MQLRRDGGHRAVELIDRLLQTTEPSSRIGGVGPQRTPHSAEACW